VIALTFVFQATKSRMSTTIEYLDQVPAGVWSAATLYG
jgi:hypothetical protein